MSLLRCPIPVAQSLLGRHYKTIPAVLCIASNSEDPNSKGKRSDHRFYRKSKKWLLGMVGFSSFGWALSQGVFPMFTELPNMDVRAWISSNRANIKEEQETDCALETERQKSPNYNDKNDNNQNGTSNSNKKIVGDLILVSGASCFPHPEKIEKGGEDAYFISKDGLTVGVADGVGGWALSGIDAGAYARLLMSSAKSAAENIQDICATVPKQVLKEAHSKTNVPGSSTACVLYLDPTSSYLHASNLGDSGFFILREDKVIFKSPPQQYQFNFPYQIGFDTSVNNTPDDAQEFTVPVIPGDVIVAGTDGLWDNMFIDECARLISKYREDGLSPQECSKRLGVCAQVRSMDDTAITPFLLGARANGYPYYSGGKPDDVTVVVSFVSKASKL